jgi:predicted MFS family arabinose efflux permease
MTNAPPATPRTRRWAVLAAYAVVLGISQMLWLNFAPLLSDIQTRYGVSELGASLLVLVFPLLYVVFSIPAGLLIDRRGYRYGVGAGVLGMALFALVRIDDASFTALLIGQIGIAVAQPYVVNGVSKLVADWFDAEQAALATGLATMGMFVGMAAGMAATPPLVSAYGLRGAMVVFAGVTIVSSLAFFALVKPSGRSAPAEAQVETRFGALLRDRQLLLLFTLAFLGLGVFNGLTTWLEPIVAPRGIDAEQAGLAGGAILGGGIVGAAAIPALADMLRKRRAPLLVCVAGAFATVYPLCHASRFSLLAGFGALHGFFFLPALALLLDVCEKHAGARAAGAATGLLMLAGNAGGVVVVVVMPLLKGEGIDWHAPVVLMTALLGLTLVLTTRVRDPLGAPRT